MLAGSPSTPNPPTLPAMTTNGARAAPPRPPRDTTDLILKELGFTPREGALIRAAHLADGMPLDLRPRKRKREEGGGGGGGGGPEEGEARKVARGGEEMGGKAFQEWLAHAEAWLVHRGPKAAAAACVIVVQAPTPYAFYNLLEHTRGGPWGTSQSEASGTHGAHGAEDAEEEEGPPSGLQAPFLLPPSPALTLRREREGRMEPLGLFLGVVASHPSTSSSSSSAPLNPSFYVATSLDEEVDGFWVGFVEPPTRAGGTLVMIGRHGGKGRLQGAVAWVLQHLQQTPSPRGIISRNEMRSVQEELARLLGQRKRWASAPVNLTRDAMTAGGEGSWLASVKVDGTRCAVLVTHKGVYAVVPFPKRFEDLHARTTVIKLGPGAPPRGRSRPPLSPSPPLPIPALMDGELLADGRLVLFDVLVHRGRNCTHKSFEERRPLVRHLVDSKGGLPQWLYLHEGACVKPVFKADGLQLAATLALREMDAPPYPVDGLILQPAPIHPEGGTGTGTGTHRKGRGYHGEQIYKWKPPSVMTIDVLAQRGPDGVCRAHVVPPGTVNAARAGERGKRGGGGRGGQTSKVVTRMFQGSDRFPRPDGVPVDLSAFVHTPYGSSSSSSLAADHRVFECCYDAADRRFHAVRVRRDRCGVPNSWYVASRVWDDIHDPVARATLELELEEEEEETEEEEG